MPPAAGPSATCRPGRWLLARRAHPHDHRPATMKADTDILSIHRGLLLFVRGWLCEAPSLDRLGSSRGAEAPLLHRIRSVSSPLPGSHPAPASTTPPGGPPPLGGVCAPRAAPAPAGR